MVPGRKWEFCLVRSRERKIEGNNPNDSSGRTRVLHYAVPISWEQKHMQKIFCPAEWFFKCRHGSHLTIGSYASQKGKLRKFDLG